MPLNLNQMFQKNLHLGLLSILFIHIYENVEKCDSRMGLYLQNQ